MSKHSIKKLFVKILLSLVVGLVCSLALYKGFSFLNYVNTLDNDLNTNQQQTKILTLDSTFNGNQYVVVKGKVYKYTTQSEQSNQEYNASSSLQACTNTLSFSVSNNFQLIFLQDSVNTLSAFAVQNNIASILTVNKQNANIEITLEYPQGTAYGKSSLDAEYTLGELATNSATSLTYTNGEFIVGNSKGATSLTATSSTDAMVMYLTGGTFTLSGDKSYSPKENTEGRALWVEGGTLNLDGITLQNFSGSLKGTVLLNSGTTNFVDVKVLNNTTSSDSIINNTGNLIIIGGEYSSNSLTLAGGGGGIINNAVEDWSNGYPPTVLYGTAEISNAKFADNTASMG